MSLLYARPPRSVKNRAVENFTHARRTCYDSGMIDAMERIRRGGRKGAKITNAMMTPEKRSRAAKKGWRLRKQKRKERAAEDL